MARTTGIYCTSVMGEIPQMWLSLRFIDIFPPITLDNGLRTELHIVKPYETNCDLWITFDWLVSEILSFTHLSCFQDIRHCVYPITYFYLKMYVVPITSNVIWFWLGGLGLGLASASRTAVFCNKYQSLTTFIFLMCVVHMYYVSLVNSNKYIWYKLSCGFQVHVVVGWDFLD